MTRIMYLFVTVNAICGIAAFFMARGLWNRMTRKAKDMLREEEPEGRPYVEDRDEAGSSSPQRR